ncbi:MAG: hypothetical protein ACTSVI_02535 [Promethearchaeota archaeon]
MLDLGPRFKTTLRTFTRDDPVIPITSPSIINEKKKELKNISRCAHLGVFLAILPLHPFKIKEMKWN